MRRCICSMTYRSWAWLKHCGRHCGWLDKKLPSCAPCSAPAGVSVERCHRGAQMQLAIHAYRLPLPPCPCAVDCFVSHMRPCSSQTKCYVMLPVKCSDRPTWSLDMQPMRER